MAKLSEETLNTIFSIQRGLAETVEEAASLEWLIFQEFGETQETSIELEELQNIRERIITAFKRLNTLVLQILEVQPSASSATLKLLDLSVLQGHATLSACQASIQEIKRNWSLP
jgi:hypothetical protein